MHEKPTRASAHVGTTSYKPQQARRPHHNFPLHVPPENENRRRTMGCSIHSLDVIKTAVKSPWLEVAMCRFNPAGTRMDAAPDKVLPVLKDLKAAGKGIVSIKVLGEGTLVDSLDEAFLFALNKNPAHCFSIGCESKEEFKDNFDRIARLSEQKA